MNPKQNYDDSLIPTQLDWEHYQAREAFIEYWNDRRVEIMSRLALSENLDDHGNVLQECFMDGYLLGLHERDNPNPMPPPAPTKSPPAKSGDESYSVYGLLLWAVFILIMVALTILVSQK